MAIEFDLDEFGSAPAGAEIDSEDAHMRLWLRTPSTGQPTAGNNMNGCFFGRPSDNSANGQGISITAEAGASGAAEITTNSTPSFQNENLEPEFLATFDQWYHVQLIRDNTLGEMRIYFDGVLECRSDLALNDVPFGQIFLGHEGDGDFAPATCDIAALKVTAGEFFNVATTYANRIYRNAQQRSGLTGEFGFRTGALEDDTSGNTNDFVYTNGPGFIADPSGILADDPVGFEIPFMGLTERTLNSLLIR